MSNCISGAKLPKNIVMRDVIELYKYFASKKYSTIAGTLVYFLIVSVTPFLFWLALIFGEVDLSGFVSHELFSAVAPVLNYLHGSALSATGGAGIILIVTSLWSASNFFYHLRRIGEIIYQTNFHKGGLKLRAMSVLVVFVTIILFALALSVPFLGFGLLEGFMPKQIADLITLSFVTIFSFFAAYLLNVFACPHKLSFGGAAQGALLTVTLWLIFAVGFTVYLQFANPQKLYGAIAAIIVFMLWCYLMINSLVIGIIYNARYYGANAIKNPPYTGRNSYS